MTGTFAVGLKGKTSKPYGPGMKIVEGAITGGSSEHTLTVDAKDIGLSRIYSAFANGYDNKAYACHVGSAGELGNYVVVKIAGPSAGTHDLGTFRILAVGE